MGVSVCMIVRNEEEFLGSTLKCIPPSYEVIVVDTGSKDHTRDIALASGARLYDFKWIDDFSAARNFSISYATGEYILVIDADELLPENTEDILSLFIQRKPGIAGTITIENQLESEVSRHRMVRFFPNEPGYLFRGIVHEVLYKDDAPSTFEDTGLILKHRGYDSVHYIKAGKAERYFPLYDKLLKDNPQDGYILYQLGKLHYSMQRYSDAESIFRKCLAVHEVDHLYFPPMLVMLGYALMEQEKANEAEKLLSPYIPQYSDFPDLPFLFGHLAMNTGKVQAVESHFKAALAIGETEKYATISGVGSFKAAYNLGVFYEVTGNREQAMHYYERAASHEKIALQRIDCLKKI